MNVFEGARRLSKVVIIAIAGLGLAITFLSSVDARLEYRVPFLGAPMLESDTCDWSTDAIEFVSLKTRSGKPYTAEICFGALRADDGKMLVPFKSDGKFTYMNGKYSPEVIAYTKEFERNYAPDDAQDKRAEDAYWRTLWKSRSQGVLVTLAVAFGFWALTKLVGWVVRGFLGVPSGQDSKPSPQA